jgi:hypothetical protein
MTKGEEMRMECEKTLQAEQATGGRHYKIPWRVRKLALIINLKCLFDKADSLNGFKLDHLAPLNHPCEDTGPKKMSKA